MTDHSEAEIVDDTVGLVLRRVVVGALATNCWIIIDARDQRAVIVDPGDEPDRILDACNDLDVRAIALTHTHWDHVLALPDIADALGVDVLAHPDDRPVWAHECQHLHRHGHFDAGTATDALLADGVPLRPPPDRALWDGRTTDIRHADTFPVGNSTALTVLHTPGHTPGGISLRAGGHVLAGDTLFPGGPGSPAGHCQTSPRSSTPSTTRSSASPMPAGPPRPREVDDHRSRTAPPGLLDQTRLVIAATIRSLARQLGFIATRRRGARHIAGTPP